LKNRGVVQGAPLRTNTRLHTIVKLLAAAVVVLMVTGLAAWFQLGQREEDSAAVLEKVANTYAESVAFLVAEYWLEAGDVRYYHNLAEGKDTGARSERPGFWTLKTISWANKLINH